MDLRRKKHHPLAVPVLLALLCAAALSAAALLLLLERPAAGQAGAPVPGPVAGYTASQEKNSAQVLSYRINGAPRFQSGGKAGTLFLENPAENVYDIQAELVDADGRVLYTSPRLEPNTHIDLVDFSGAPLPAGEHQVSARIYAIDRASSRAVGHVEQAIRLFIAE